VLEVLTVCEHLDQELREHLQHFGLNMHMIVKVVVPQVAKLDFLEVDLDTDFTHVKVLQSHFLLHVVSRLVRDVSKSKEDFLGPELKERVSMKQSAALLSQELLQRDSLLHLEEILVVFGVAHVVKTQVRREVLRKQELLGSPNLVKELSQELIMLKDLGDLVAFNWEVFI